ncbi:uncharacterized protein LOC118410486 [Branchiostoma floridae]|uniref:Uncharacterized protein LOC118410486 n=1 Tax=Branchiostoma floridae TaxID=7739 RepID=A0A9J7MIJ2_BRAFL|nr:uncharacterized protein LOC118410486 [Branchiostoma floridae]
MSHVFSVHVPGGYLVVRHLYKVPGRSCVEQIISGFRAVTRFNLQSSHRATRTPPDKDNTERSMLYKMSGRLSPSIVLCLLAMVCVVSSGRVDTEFECLMKCLGCSQMFETSKWNGLACKLACANTPYNFNGNGIDAFCTNFVEP